MADSGKLSDAKRSLLEKYLRGQVPAQVRATPVIKPRTTGRTAPLSFSQQQVWLHSQIAANEIPVYNETLTVHRNGPLDVEVLSRTLNEILRRHEIWRTTFDVVDGEPVQIVQPAESGFDLPVVDLRSLTEEERNERAAQLAIVEARKPFDLRQGPLRRALLIRLADEQYRLYLTFHQLIFDGVTAYQVFLPELAAIYEAFSQGKASPLPEPEVQYADYAVWQREHAREQEGKELEYWQEALRGELPVLEWPLHRPAIRTHRGDIKAFSLGPESLAALTNLSRQQHVSLFMILVAGLSAVLHRYTGQDDIIVGAPTAGRNLPQVQGMLGYFLNILPLRINLSGDPSFNELLARVKEAVLGALSHQEVSFTRLVETIRPTADPSRNAFFQVAISLEPPVKLADNGWSATQSDIPTGASKLDLYIDVGESANGIHGPVTYNPDIFEAAAITRMMDHWRTLLVAAADEPETRLSKLPILTERERDEVLVEWNATESEYPQDKCIHHLFSEQCRRTPDAAALLHGGETYSFRVLDDTSNHIATSLRSAGVASGSRVAVCLERSPEFVAAALAIFKIGAAYVPLDPSYPADRLAFMLEDCGPSAIVTTGRLLDRLHNFRVSVVCLDGGTFKGSGDENSKTIEVTTDSESAAYVIYTSGSTGEPRGVVGSHRACLNRFSWMWREYPFVAGEVCCHKTNLSFVDSVWEIFGPLLAGVPNLIIPGEAVRDPEKLLQMLAANRVTRIVVVPSLLRSLLDHAPNLGERLPHLKLWSCSGEVLSVELAARFRVAHPTARLLNIYGSSEVAADVTCYEVSHLGGLSSVPIGKPISNTQVYILDRYSNPLPAGIGGEIYVGGAGLAVGYWKRPDLTKERFVESPLNRGETLFRTGDLGRWRATGDIEYLGRADTQVKLRGMRLELGEVEAVLAGYDKVREAAVALSGEEDERRLTAYVTAWGGAVPCVEELRRYLRTKLPEHMIPSEYVLLDRLPLLPSGKVDRKALATTPGKVLRDEKDICPPRTQLEKKLGEMWQELLRVEQVDIERNFFELGGHSLIVLQLIARIRKAFDVEIPVQVVFEQPTIAQLAIQIEKLAMAGNNRARVRWKARSAAAGGHGEELLAELESLPPTDAQSILRRVLNDKRPA